MPDVRRADIDHAAGRKDALQLTHKYSQSRHVLEYVICGDSVEVTVRIPLIGECATSQTLEPECVSAVFDTARFNIDTMSFEAGFFGSLNDEARGASDVEPPPIEAVFSFEAFDAVTAALEFLLRLAHIGGAVGFIVPFAK